METSNIFIRWGQTFFFENFTEMPEMKSVHEELVISSRKFELTKNISVLV
jgi:hypothetical protein